VDINYQELIKVLLDKKSHEDIADEIYPLEESDIEAIHKGIDSLDLRERMDIKSHQIVSEKACSQLNIYFDRNGIWESLIKCRHRNGLFELITRNNEVFYELLKVAQILDQEEDLRRFDINVKLSEIKRSGSESEREFIESTRKIVWQNYLDLIDMSRRWDKIKSSFRLIESNQVIWNDLFDRLEITVEDANFTVHTHNILSRAGIKTLGQLSAYSEKELLEFRRLGIKSLAEIKNELAKHKLELKKE
jgi:hypothetical protein